VFRFQNLKKAYERVLQKLLIPFQLFFALVKTIHSSLKPLTGAQLYRHQGGHCFLKNLFYQIKK
jgi:hypothetical protein